MVQARNAQDNRILRCIVVVRQNTDGIEIAATDRGVETFDEEFYGIFFSVCIYLKRQLEEI